MIEVNAWVEAESQEEARDKLENMDPAELKRSLQLEKVLDLHPNEIENAEDIYWQELQ